MVQTTKIRYKELDEVKSNKKGQGKAPKKAQNQLPIE